jgi:WD40 repeat protein
MGVVYRAHDEQTGEAVALKLLLPEIADDAETVARLEREARLAAAIRHPNVARLVFTGELQGHRVLAFELVPGGSLEDRLANGPLPWREATRLGAGIARGLEAVHAAGLIHRDLKPGNVLLSVDGEPRLSDFGLARSLSSATRLTQTGEVMGTPSFMAPEQIEATKYVGPGADVYALGATLFALLAGRPPFEGTGVALMKQVLVDRPPHVRQLALDVPPALDALVARLLEKAPESRGDAARAAKELEALAGSPVRTGARSWTVRAATLGALGLGVAAVAVGLRARSGPEPKPGPSVVTPVVTETSATRPSPRPIDPAVAAELEALIATEKKPWRLRTAYGDGRWKHAGNINGAVFLPDGRLLTGGDDASVRLWDLASGTYVAFSGPKGPILTVAASPDGKVVAAGGVERVVFVWDVDRPGSPTPISGFEGDVRSVVLANGRTVYAACDVNKREGKGALRVFHGATNGVPALTYTPEICALALAPGGKNVLGACGDGCVHSWDAERLDHGRLTAPVSSVSLTAIAVSSDGAHALTASEPWSDSEPAQARTKLWDLPEWRESSLGLSTSTKRAYAVAFSGDGTLAATSDMDGDIRITDLAGKGRDVAMKCSGGWPNAIAFEPRTDRLVVCPWSVVEVRDLRAPARAVNLTTDALEGSEVRSVSPSKDGRRALVGYGQSQSVTLVDLGTGRGLAHARLRDGCRAVGFAADGTALAADRTLVVERLRPDDLVRTSECGPSAGDLVRRALTCALANGGKRLFVALDDAGSGGSWLESWDLPPEGGDATSVVGYPDAGDSTLSIAISTDGRRGVSGNATQAILWDLESNKPIKVHDTEHHEVNAVAIAATGRRYAWASDRRAHVFDRRGRDDVAVALLGPLGDQIYALALSPDENLLAVSSLDGRIRLLDTRHPDEAPPTIDLSVVGDVSRALAFVDDRTLLAGTERGLLLVFELER